VGAVKKRRREEETKRRREEETQRRSDEVTKCFVVEHFG
jgi:hypothetical protein